MTGRSKRYQRFAATLLAVAFVAMAACFLTACQSKAELPTALRPIRTSEQRRLRFGQDVQRERLDFREERFLFIRDRFRVIGEFGHSHRVGRHAHRDDLGGNAGDDPREGRLSHAGRRGRYRCPQSGGLGRRAEFRHEEEPHRRQSSPDELPMPRPRMPSPAPSPMVPT